MQLILLGAILVLVYTYLIYPLLLLPWTRKKKADNISNDEELPYISILVSAYNEEHCIGQKIQNCLALEYPREKLEIWIGSDGSTDRTDEIVSAFRDERVHLLRRERGGKAAMLNELARRARGEILVFSDANTELEKGALRAIVRPFSDPEVGLVSGELHLYNPHTPHREDEEGLYWRYERFLKRREGARGVLIGANGGLYALRASLFSPLPHDTLTDDFEIAARILEAGKKVTYAQEARAREETAGGVEREFSRRVRIGAGNFQALFRHLKLLSPRRPRVAFSFFSHKVLRWLAPFFLIAAFIANLALANRSPYDLLLLGQLAFYALAASGKGRLAKIFRYFLAMNAALALGLYRFLFGKQQAAWQRTARLSELNAGAGGRD